MGFVATKSPTYYAPATHRMLSEDGSLVISKFDCQFKRLTKSELLELEARLKLQGEKQLRDRQLLVEVMTGWRAVEEADGTAAKFSIEQVDRYDEQYIGFQKSCVESFFASTAPSESAHLAAKN